MARRSFWLHIAIPAVVLGACIATQLSAQTASNQDSVESRIEQMQKQLDDVLRKNAELDNEVQQLKGGDWMTEQRSEEIKQLVADVLADADTRASLLDTGMTAGWSDGFFLASADGRFRLNIAGQMQIRWIYSFIDEPDRHRQGFENTRTRMTFSGHVFSRDLQYLVRTEFTRNEPQLVQGLNFIQDAWVRFQLNDSTSIRVGQFKVPFNREELVSSAHQLAVERSNVNESLNLGRTQGIELVIADDVHRFAVSINDGASDSLGGFTASGGGIATSTVQVGDPIHNFALFQDVEYAIQGRYEYIIAGSREQFEDFTSPIDEPFAAMVGVAAHAQQTESNGAPGFTRDEIRWVGWTVDASVEFGGANVFASFTHHYVDRGGFVGQFNFYGVVVQGGYYITPKWEVFGRYEWGMADSKNDLFANPNDLSILTFGANYYFDGHSAKWTTDIGFALNEISDEWDFNLTGYRLQTTASAPQIVFRTQFQLLF